MTELVLIVCGLLPLDVFLGSPTATPPPAVYPRQNHGFAAYILGGFFGLGILVLAMVLLNLRPKRVDPPAPDP
jgi:hypothetical protein